MKAYMVFNGDPFEGCLLVYAESANKARSISHNHIFDWEYVETSAIREPEYDRFYKDGDRRIIEDNDELPEGAPEFYNDEVFNI